MNETLQKRIHAHARTIGAWLSSTQTRREGETNAQLFERMEALGANHALKPVNGPLLRAIQIEILENGPLPEPALKIPVGELRQQVEAALTNGAAKAMFSLTPDDISAILKPSTE